MGHAQGMSMLYLEARCVVGRARRRLAGRPERLHLVRRARALGAGRHARDPRRERARRVARPRGRLRATTRSPRTRAIRKTAKLMGQFLPGHGLRHVRLLGHAAPRQHVRRRQLRRRRPRRVADDPARLAGRRRDRAGRRGRAAARARARARGRSRRSSPSSGCRPSPTTRSAAATTAYDSRRPPRPRPRGRRRGGRRPARARGLGARRRARARPRGVRRRRRGDRRDVSASASRPTTSRPRP